MSRLVWGVAVLIAVVAAAIPSGAWASRSWPQRDTALSSTLGWFDAINAHDRRRLLSYVAPEARAQMGWARPSVRWSKFTHLRCRQLRSVSPRRALISCSFHESASPVEGNPDSFWVVQLRRTPRGWLIDDYGQG